MHISGGHKVTVVTVRCVHQICVAAKIHTASIRREGYNPSHDFKYSENAKSCKALVIMYINKFILLPSLR